MSTSNRISAVLTVADSNAASASIASIRGKLPFLLSMTARDRAKLLKLGDDRLALDEDANVLMKDHPTLVPTYVNVAELEKDRVLRLQLDELRLALQVLLDDVVSTEMQLGAEMLQAYLGFYSNSKEAAKRGVPAAKTVMEVLSKYFARPSRSASAAAINPS